MISYSKLAVAISQCTPNEYVYGVDIASDSKKKYIVGTDNAFASWYSQQHSKHVHEVLLSDKQCHLFFDIEYLRTEYREADENLIIDTVLKLARMCVPKRVFDACTVILLCASDDTKMSWHIILNGIIFNNIHEMGMFVRFMVMNKGRQNFADLFYGLNGCVVDLCVYGRNRTFRIWGSTKMGSTRMLYRMTPENKFINANGTDVNISETLVMCRNVETSNIIQIPKRYYTQSRTYVDVPEKFRGIVTWMQERFPTVKIYGAKLCGNIITVALMSRKCVIAGKEHKSNHVTINVDLKNCNWYMGCFKCRGKGQMRSISDRNVLRLCKK